MHQVVQCIYTVRIELYLCADFQIAGDIFFFYFISSYSVVMFFVVIIGSPRFPGMIVACSILVRGRTLNSYSSGSSVREVWVVVM